MDLTPNEIRNQEFGTQMRGYDKGEVDSCLQQAAKSLEDACVDIKKLSDEVMLVKGQMARYKEFEDSIKAAAIDARRNADDLMNDASAKAEQIIADAKEQANDYAAEQKINAERMKKQIADLADTRESYTNKLRDLINSHLELVNAVEGLEIQPPTSSEPIEVTNSSEVDARTHETMATEPSMEDQHVESGEVGESPQSTVEESPIDPELAAALNQYQNQAQHDVGESPAVPGMADNVVITTARAEDIPPGFIVKDENEAIPSSTDRVPSSQEPNPVGATQGPGPTKIAQDIEDAVEKFEKEIENAHQ